jgi:predicted GNAT superfamily acetyltransferase
MRNSVPDRDGISMSGIEAPRPIPAQLTIRPCHSHDDLKLCVDLQKRIWGYAGDDVVPTAIFVVAQHTGGHAYCAFDRDQAVGFALAFSAERDGRRFWHSHMVGVLPEYQNQGVGRLLKLHQRDEALRLGIPDIEWTFDPLESRNAHFNIAVLGAIARQYIPDCYGESTSPLHGTLPTDRLVAEWRLVSPRVEAAVTGRPIPAPGPNALEISVPTHIRALKSSDPNRAREFQEELRHRFTDLFSRGNVVTGFRRGIENSQYVLEPYED